MQIKGLQRLIKLATRIGLKTLGDLEYFYKHEAAKGEDLITTLERYNEEVGEDFKIEEK